MRSAARSLVVVLLLAAAVPVAIAAPAHAGYRLAGIVAAADTRIGFLEVPEGGQVLVRPGSKVHDGEVVQIGERSLRIRFPDGTVELSLEGSGKPQPVAATKPADPAQPAVVAGDEQGHVIRRTVDVGLLNEGLGAAPSAADASRARASGAAPDPQRQVAQRFAPLLDLPSDSRVTAVNEARVISASAAIDAVEQTLANGMPARLNLQTPGGTKRVYLLPAGNGTTTGKKK